MCVIFTGGSRQTLRIFSCFSTSSRSGRSVFYHAWNFQASGLQLCSLENVDSKSKKKSQSSVNVPIARVTLCIHTAFDTSFLGIPACIRLFLLSTFFCCWKTMKAELLINFCKRKKLEWFSFIFMERYIMLLN